VVENALRFDLGAAYIPEWSAFSDFEKPEDELSQADILVAANKRAEWLRGTIQELRKYQRKYEEQEFERIQRQRDQQQRDQLAQQLEAQRNKGIIGNKIFFGHGRSKDWSVLALHLTAKLKLEYDEYNRDPTAGRSRKEVLENKMDSACMAFLVMTAEDDQPDGTVRARENVIHEVGLFQGRLGFHRAIVLLEEGCNEFSNIEGLEQLRFPRGRIETKFAEIEQLLQREGVLR